MSNIETAKRFAALVEAKDFNGLQAILADDFTAKGPSMELNKQQVVGYLKVLFTAFPDHSFGMTNFEEKSDSVYCDSYEKGTHHGTLDLNPFGLPVTLPPTGKVFTLPKGRFAFRVADNRITYFHEEAIQGGGLAGILAQLGVKLA